MQNLDDDNVGRPLQPGTIDHQEIQRRYDKEESGDINNLISQKKQEYSSELNQKDKIAYIKGEVNLN